ncbi:hypothetical protein [Bacillus cereus]|jgi:hypothetical protein|uniref:Uncharacterized protein n=1 Tax=Bacillus cereus TaxID=1396 RepID=A0A164QCE8_BACCE|nr:hypothetical protein [Bacillus cereus]KZD70954.1 hypothetical protein B4088_1010 [Bacillus cereus]
MHKFEWIEAGLNAIDKDISLSTDIYCDERFEIGITHRNTMIVFDDFDEIVYFENDQFIKTLSKRKIRHYVKDQTLSDFLESMYRAKFPERHTLKHQIDFYREIEARLNQNTYYFFQPYCMGFWIEE